MRKFLLFSALLFSIFFCESQEDITQVSLANEQQYNFHIEKKKSNNLAGWIVLGSGVAMVFAGLGINMKDGIVDGDSTNNNQGLWLSYLGGATTLVSIPLFLAGGKHKRKANLIINNNKLSFTGLNYTSMSLFFN